MVFFSGNISGNFEWAKLLVLSNKLEKRFSTKKFLWWEFLWLGGPSCCIMDYPQDNAEILQQLKSGSKRISWNKYKNIDRKIKTILRLLNWFKSS